jgi:predicted phage-related endonuclease
VESETYYPPVNVDDASRIHPTADGSVELPGRADRVERLVRLREDAKELEVQIDALQTEIMSEMRDAEIARAGSYTVKWPVRHYKAQPEKVTPAKDARTVRLKTLQIAH